MEQELIEACKLYQDNILSVKESLELSPGDPELTKLLAELEDALGIARQALGGFNPDLNPAESTPGTDDPGDAPELRQAGAPPQAAVPSVSHNGCAACPNIPASITHIGPELPTHLAHNGQHSTAGSAACTKGTLPAGPQMHPRNKYATQIPDFAALAVQYPSLQPYLQRRGGGSRPSIDFTSQEACRELTKVLLRHDYGIDWWIPLGQLVPPITNRANYIHWLEDLLGLSAPEGGAGVVGLDVGCGANLIYPLLGAAMNGWGFVGVDVTKEAVEWAGRNRRQNPHLAPLIEVRRAGMQPEQCSMLSGVQLAQQKRGEGEEGREAKRARLAAGGSGGGAGGGSPPEVREGQEGTEEGRAEEGAGEGAAHQPPAAARVGGCEGVWGGAQGQGEGGEKANGGRLPAHAAEQDRLQQAQRGAWEQPQRTQQGAGGGAGGGGILSGAVREGERFAFSMCNPPFFGSMKEAGRNPSTAYAGTAAEMVYPGGELAFVSAMVRDSLVLGDRIHWYTTMVGKKATMKAVRTLLYRHGVRVLRTTEFVQGKTSRWAIAWSLAANPNVATKPLPRPPPASHPFL